jgi:uncharacterized protein
MTIEKDFSHLARFPGETGNPFDIALHRLVRVQQIPFGVFTFFLGLLAAFSTWWFWPSTAVLLGFMLADWLALALLPRFEKSFGPPRPPVLILALLRSLVALLFSPLPWGWSLQVIGSLLVVFAFWIEPHTLHLTRQSLNTSKLPSGHHLRILHLGDLHIERITHREQALQAYIEQILPDLILFSGDILNLSYLNDPVAFAQARQVIEKWRAPLGVFGVSGSPAVDLPELFPQILEGLPIRRLDNEKVSMRSGSAQVELIGITCTHRPHMDGPELQRLVDPGPEQFTILLYHSPDLAPMAARVGIDLQLSGHTHGGQVRIPGFGALFTGSLYGKAFEAGRILVGSMVLYVTRGIGMEGAAAPRLRLFCPPEIIVWEITGTGTR